VPNAVYLSVVQRIGDRHVALSRQFFRKTAQNIRRNPLVQLLMVSPETADQYRLDLVYERTETEGSDFDRMRMRLDAVASQIGMSKVFRLRGLDIYRVLDCRAVAGVVRSPDPRKTGELSHLDAFTERLAACEDLERVIEVGLEQISDIFGYKHIFVMMPDEDGHRLFTVASLGYEPSGAGSEVVVGEGILGLVAKKRTPIRITNIPRELQYSRAVRGGLGNPEGGSGELEVPLPGIDELRSQLAVPLIALNEFLGVLCLQRVVPCRRATSATDAPG
jgi:adenylate cyclase